MTDNETHAAVDLYGEVRESAAGLGAVLGRPAIVGTVVTDRKAAVTTRTADEADDEERCDYATYCPDCGQMFFEDDEGFDWDECFECGEGNCYEVPA